VFFFEIGMEAFHLHRTLIESGLGIAIFEP